MTTPNEITCPSCGLVATPERRRLTGREIGEGTKATASHAMSFGWFCPSRDCRARVDRAVEEMLASPRENDVDLKTEPAPHPVSLSSMTTRAPTKNATNNASRVSLFDQIRSQRADLVARVAFLRAELSLAERDLEVIDKMFALLPSNERDGAAQIAAE